MRNWIKRVSRRPYRNEVYISDRISDADMFKMLFTYGIQAFRGFFTFGIKKHGLLFRSKGSVLKFREKIVLGSNVRLGRYVKLSGLGERLSIGDNVSIGDFSCLIVSTTVSDPKGKIYIGANVGIGEYAYIGGAGGVSIGSDTIIGQYLSIHPQNHSIPREGDLVRLMPTFEKGITIGRNCWLGSKVTVLDGASIGDNCVVAAGAVVRGEFPANTLIGGVPAKVMKHL